MLYEIVFTKEQNTKIHFKKYPNPIKPYKSHFKCFLIAKITSSERGRKKQIKKSVNNGRETCTSVQRGKTPRKRFLMEKKSWIHVLKRWEENANFQ